MGEYVDIKRNKIKNFLKWLCQKCSDIEVKKGSNHNTIVKYIFGDRPFPIPLKHNVVNKHIIKDFMKKLTKDWKVCSKDEFDKKIK